MSNHADTALVPVVEGLFEIVGNSPLLLGTQCASCGTQYFPQAFSCRNPDCAEKQILPARLASQGTLNSYTLQRYQPPSMFRWDDWRPYLIGVADLGHGVQVMGILKVTDPDEVAIGMPVRLVLHELYEDGGNAVVTYAFAPEPTEGSI